MNQLLNHFASSLAVGFGLGLMPRAPGTWGSLLGLPLAATIYWLADRYFGSGPQVLAHLTAAGWSVAAVIFILLIGISRWVIQRTEQLWQVHDDGRIVIDEVVGQAMCIAMFKPNFWVYLAGFALFRLLDISKPGLIGWADRELPGAWGTLLDDVLAGLIGAGIMVGIYEIYVKIL
jgi:phosphatidylglycerophosphatase A